MTSPSGEGSTLPEELIESPSSISYSEYSLSSLASQDESFQVRNHAELSLVKMHQYYVKNQLTDVMLIAGDKKIMAHRIVLSASSEYFSAMFTSDLKESHQKTILLQDVDGDALQNLVFYCYTGKIELREDSVETLLGTACLLRLCEVVEACCVFLKKQLHPSNAIGIYLFADSQACCKLRDDALFYVFDHFMEVIGEQEFLMLQAKEVARLLSSDDLNVPSEEAIYKALIQWVNHDREARKSDLEQLLPFVKIPLLSASFIADHVQTEEYIKNSTICQGLILEAFNYHLLPERRASLQSFRTIPRKSTVGQLWAFGGIESSKVNVASSIEAYSYMKDKWTHVDFMTGRRLQFGVAVIENKVYIVGGRDGLKTLNKVECFDMETKSWSSLPSMCTHRHGLGVAVMEGPIYAVGGHDGWSFLNTVERYDPQTKLWSCVSPMATQRSTVGVAVLNNKLYAVGGRDGCSCLQTVECYDPHTDRWTSCAPMTKRRGGVGVGVMNGYLYAVGGHDIPGPNPYATRNSSVERYDPKTDTWTTIASLSVGRDAVAVCLIGEKLFAVGGFDGLTCLRIVEAYDVSKDQWVKMAPLNTPRAGSCVVALNSVTKD